MKGSQTPQGLRSCAGGAWLQRIQQDLAPDAVCEACGRHDAVQIGERWLCPDCISVAGSCCPEFGAWDAWSSDSGVAPRCYQPASMPHLVTHDTTRQRFEMRPTPEAPPAFLEYTITNGLTSFNHTFVPDALRGQGIAAVLTLAALEEARQAGWKIVPACSYVAAYIEHHPDFTDLIAKSDSP